jgi:3'-phosphoadenosine 5'-phosphosulfate (PAPS) 3'-phosphatase
MLQVSRHLKYSSRRNQQRLRSSRVGGFVSVIILNTRKKKEREIIQQLVKNERTDIEKKKKALKKYLWIARGQIKIYIIIEKSVCI